MEQVSFDAYVFDALMPDLVGHDRTPAALVVYLHLYRRASAQNSTRGSGEASWSVRLSLQVIADGTGLSRSAVQSALAHLQRRQLVQSTRANPTAVPLHRVLRPWQRLSRAGRSSQ